MEREEQKRLHNDRLKAFRKALLGWIFVWSYLVTIYISFGVRLLKIIVIFAVFYDLSLHILTFIKDPYKRKWGWVIYPVIFQRDESVNRFDFRYHLFWIPFWATVLILIVVSFFL